MKVINERKIIRILKHFSRVHELVLNNNFKASRKCLLLGYCRAGRYCSKVWAAVPRAQRDRLCWKLVSVYLR